MWSEICKSGIVRWHNTYRHYCYAWNNGVTCEGFRCDSRRLSCSQSLEFCSLNLNVAVHLLAVFLGFYKFYAGEVLFQSPIELFVMSYFPQLLFTEKFCHTRPCKYVLDSSNHLLPTIRLITYTSYTAWWPHTGTGARFYNVDIGNIPNQCWSAITISQCCYCELYGKVLAAL